jgi:Putative Flp pilus-assembly TadE/G-like/von Willebrand factor type A domain
MGRHHSRTGALSEEHGQAVIFVVIFMVAVIAVVGFVIDVGHAYEAQRSLQGAADAAALAGAQQLPDPAAAQQTAQQYGSSAAGKNHITDVVVNEQIATSCNATIPGCSPVNMVSVDERASVPTYFSKIIGVNSLDLKVHAAACSPCGAKAVDIMLVLDRTGSMCQDSTGRDMHPTCPDMNNAKDGLRTFLGYFDPNMAHVGFAVLPPAVDPSRPCDAPGSYNSTGYELVPLSSDFRRPDGTLNSSSSLVSTINCVQSNGSTAYANAIEAAQAELNQHGRPNVPKIIVFASDGAANTGPGYYPSTSPYRTRPCGQGVASAATVKAAGTIIYSIGYALDDATGGCVNSVTRGAETPAITVRQALQGIASSPDKFLERPQPGELQTIFSSIAQDISHGSSSLIN